MVWILRQNIPPGPRFSTWLGNSVGGTLEFRVRMSSYVPIHAKRLQQEIGLHQQR